MTPETPAIQRAAKFAATAAAYVAGLVLVLLMLGTVADVIARGVYHPIPGVFDLTHFAVVIMVFLGLPYCTYYGAHAAIELLYERLGPAAAKALQRLIDLAGAIILIVIAWQTAISGIQIKEFNQTSQMLMIPQYPLYWVVVVGCLMFALVLLLHSIRPALKESQSEQ